MSNDAPEEAKGRETSQKEPTLTSEEAATDCGDDDLEAKETAHRVQNVAVLLVDGVNSDDMDQGAGGEEDSCADGFEEEEVGALLGSALAQASEQGAIGPSAIRLPRAAFCRPSAGVPSSAERIGPPATALPFSPVARDEDGVWRSDPLREEVLTSCDHLVSKNATPGL